MLIAPLRALYLRSAFENYLTPLVPGKMSGLSSSPAAGLLESFRAEIAASAGSPHDWQPDEWPRGYGPAGCELAGASSPQRSSLPPPELPQWQPTHSAGTLDIDRRHQLEYLEQELAADGGQVRQLVISKLKVSVSELCFTQLPDQRTQLVRVTNPTANVVIVRAAIVGASRADAPLPFALEATEWPQVIFARLATPCSSGANVVCITVHR